MKERKIIITVSEDKDADYIKIEFSDELKMHEVIGLLQVALQSKIDELKKIKL